MQFLVFKLNSNHFSVNNNLIQVFEFNVLPLSACLTFTILRSSQTLRLATEVVHRVDLCAC